MIGSRYRPVWSAAIATAFGFAALSGPSAALAYVGPGAGLTMVGSLLAVAFALVIALVGLVLFPLRLLMKRIKAGKAAAASEAAPPKAADRT